MRKLLLVEDEDILRSNLERFLGQRGREVLAAGEYARAAELLGSGAFDLLVTDLVLPDGDGSSLVEQAGALGMEVIVITAHSSPALEARLAARGMTCLVKPFGLAALEESVEAALRRRVRSTP